jgi:hypothetical protein
MRIFTDINISKERGDYHAPTILQHLFFHQPPFSRRLPPIIGPGRQSPLLVLLAVCWRCTGGVLAVYWRSARPVAADYDRLMVPIISYPTLWYTRVSTIIVTN